MVREVQVAAFTDRSNRSGGSATALHGGHGVAKMALFGWGADAGKGALDPNSHIRANLKFYLELPEPPYHAIMLEGPWGGGKTYLVKRLLAQLKKSGTRHVYVSLYGVGSKAEFDRAVLAGVHPFIEHKAVKASLQLISGLLTMARFSTSAKLEEYLEKFDADVFIFDDLERCEVPLTTVLGYVNPFVEHAGCKVVLIANESEIAQDDKDEYRRRKEKVVGRTLSISPDLSNAIPAFIGRIKDRGTRRYLQQNMPLVEQVARQAGHGNLRVIQQSLWDFARFHQAMPWSLQSKSNGMAHVLGTFLALSMEFKVGSLGLTILSDRSQYGRFLMDKKAPPTPLAVAADKYPGIDLYDQTLDNDLVADMFSKGRFDPAAIARSLGVSSWFATPGQVPSWRIVWDKHIWDDQAVRAAIEDVEAKFAARHYVEQGEILHVFGLRLTLAQERLLAIDVPTIVAEAKTYVDDLKKSKKLAPYINNGGDLLRAHDGLGFSGREKPEFREMLSYLVGRQGEVLEGGYPDQAAHLMVEMVEDRNLFWRRINYSNTTDGRFTHLPIFTHVDAKHFVETLLQQSNSAQFEILKALLSRYDGGKLARDLATERPWIMEVRDLLMAEASNADVLRKNRLTDITNWTIGKAIRDVEEAEEQQRAEQGRAALRGDVERA
jgi:hypothetical protein